MKRRISPIMLVLLVLGFLGGCAALGGVVPDTAPPAPRNVAEAIAQGHVAIQEVTLGVERALALRAIPALQASVCYGKLMEAEEGLVMAREFLTLGDQAEASGQLAAAEALILAVRTQLPGGK